MSRLIVKNIPKGTTEQKLKTLFSKKGAVTDVQLKYTDAGVFRRFGFVGFETEDEAVKAADYFNNSHINTTKISVEICKTLGDTETGNSYSKHSKIKKPKDDKPEDIPKKSKNIPESVEDIIKEHKSDPLFLEYMQSHSKNTKFWEADVAIPGVEITKPAPSKTTNETQKEIEKPKVQKAVVDTDLFTVKLMNIPYSCKRSDVIKFFKPIKPFSIRIPRHGFAFAGFKTKAEFTKALQKDRSFLKEKQVFVIDYCERNKMDVEQTTMPVVKNSKWAKQEDALLNEENINESGKIYFRNLPYTVMEKDLQIVFEKYGPVAEMHLPIDTDTKQIKGFGTVTYLMPEHAIQAFNELNGTPFHGRMLHLLPGKTKKDKQIDYSSLSIKEKKMLKQKQNAENPYNWNSLFMGPNAVADALALNYNTTKDHVLNTSDGGSNAAVRLALGETEIVAKIRNYLEENGIYLDAFNALSTSRSKQTIIAKNLPAGTTEDELKKIFAPFGSFKIILPPNGVTAVIDFLEIFEAKSAFKRLAYSKFKHVPLYLEWAPENIFQNRKDNDVNEYKVSIKEDTSSIAKISNDGEQHSAIYDENKKEISVSNGVENEEDTDSIPEEGTTIFLRNLNFNTIEATIEGHFKKLGPIHSIQIAQKRDATKESGKASLGYGFIQFKKRETLEKALKLMQSTTIDGNTVELKRSDRILKSEQQSSRKACLKTKQTGTKMLVRNIAFQTKESEIRELFKTFGELRAIRLPMKMGEDAHRGFGFVDFLTASDAKKAFDALSQSTHLYGRRLVLEWANVDEENVDNLRKRTANHFVDDSSKIKRSRKGVFETSNIKIINDE